MLEMAKPQHSRTMITGFHKTTEFPRALAKVTALEQPPFGSKQEQLILFKLAVYIYYSYSIFFWLQSQNVISHFPEGLFLYNSTHFIFCAFRKPVKKSFVIYLLLYSLIFQYTDKPTCGCLGNINRHINRGHSLLVIMGHKLAK